MSFPPSPLLPPVAFSASVARPSARRLARPNGVIAPPSWKPFYWHSAMLLLLVLQLVSGTQPTFAFLIFLFCQLTYWAVKECGGIWSLTGFCVLYMAMQNVLVSQAAKLLYWQPADSYLMQPEITALALDTGMFGIGLAAAAARRLGTLRRKPLFDVETQPARLLWIAVVCTLLSVFQAIYTATQSIDADTGTTNVGGIHGILHSLSYLSPLAVASGTAYTILSSRGRKSFGIINGIAIAVPCLFGIIGAGRQMMIATIVMYYLTCFLFRFKFRPVHYTIVLVGVYILQFILFPYALYARSFTRTAHLEENISRASTLLLDVISDPIRYQQRLTQHKGLSHEKFLYYGRPVPTLDRFSLIVITDGIVDATLRSGTVGMETISPGFEMVLPRFFSPDKITVFPNLLAHREPGMVDRHDYTTGISTGFVSDSFSSFGWAGALGIPFLLSLCLFTAFRFIVRDNLRQNVFAICLTFYLSWQFSDTNIALNTVLILQGSVVTAFVLFAISSLANAMIGLTTRVRRGWERETPRVRPLRAIQMRPAQTRRLLARNAEARPDFQSSAHFPPPTP